MTEEANPVGSSQPEGVVTPVVIERRSRRDRRYSMGLGTIQVMERHYSRALRRVARSFENGLSAYEEARDESARETRDGAIVDFIPNVAEGLSSLLDTLVPLPNDLAKALYPVQVRRAVRDATRMVNDIYSDFDDVEDDLDDDDDEE